MTRRPPRLLAVLAAALVAVPAAPTGAMAAPSPTAPALTWAVQPADERGPDGRRWMEHTLDAGQVVTERLAVRNFSDRPAEFSLKAADGYLTDKGRFNMLPSSQKSVDGGTWIRVQEKVTVAAKGTAVVPFTITVPRDARPGDHPAGIAATVTATGGTVAVESRVGFRVMMRVSGTVTASLAVDGLTTTYRRSWNPFSAGSILVRYTVTNDGSVAATGTAEVTTSELFGAAEHGARAEVARTLPGGGREVEVRVAGVWALGPLATTVDLTPAALESAEVRPTSATVTVWTLPWPQLLLAALLAAVALTARTAVRRRRRRLAELLARARDEGRAEAHATTSGPAGG
ncbi:hypothetical protein RB614_05895 [Phytohabitans sp. ZYX-F-186]|uniref:DUF916 domain-containing protein n=1 Tax=Phytohabitans maris TaxID=3071409 RepID=A0ABU0ZAG7_9ACTN|nr:hypothetical protein [Phytohabitans sp. ZYX-F-186]MDQ7904054.1 hypothetical protein [Phytohabitans sp. ZYX-F-186]